MTRLQVIGYSETTTILDDLIVLSGVGTAANMKFPFERRAKLERGGAEADEGTRLESKRYYRDDTMERGERSERREQRMAEKR